MARGPYNEHLRRADTLIANVIRHAPAAGPVNDEFRADLAGMLCVSCAAAYENSIKEILSGHARSKNASFGSFVEKSYTKLNSKISRDDLNYYAKLFDDNYEKKFKEHLDDVEKKISERLKISVKNSYASILSWRHAFAHSGQRISTLDEVHKTHLFAKRVIHCYAYALL